MNDLLKYRLATLRIVGIYALVGCLWIYTSDTVLYWFVQDPHIMAKIAIYKGSFYVIFTSLLLYFLIYRFNSKLAVSEHTIRERENKFSSIFDHSPIAIGIGEFDSGQMVEVNEAWLRLFGFERNEVLGRTTTDLSLYLKNDERNQIIRIIKDKGSIVNKPVQMRHKSGSVIDVMYSAELITLASKPFLQVMMTDVTELKKHTDLLNEREEKYRNLFNNSGVCMFRTRLDGSEVLDVNQKYLDILGRSREEVIGKPSVILWADPKEREEMVKTLLSEGHVSELEIKILNSQNDVRNCLASLMLYREQGIVEGSIIDITERKLAEEAIKTSEDKYSRAFNACPAAIVLVSMDDGKCIEVNDIFCTTTGYQRDEVIGHTSSELGFWLDTNARQQYLDDLNKYGSLRNHEISYRMRNNEVRNFLVSSELIEIGGKRCSLNFILDISERKKAEESLRITRFSVEHSSDGIFWMTPDARIVDVNAAACRSLGYSREELLQLSIPDIDPFYNADIWRQHFIDLRQHSTLTFETVHTTKDGTQFPVEIVANHIQFGSEERNCSIVRNITDRKQTEAVQIRLMLRQRAILDNLPMMAWLKDTEGHFEMVNEPFSKAAGLTIEQCIGKNDLEIWPDREIAKRYMDDDKEICLTGNKKLVEEPISMPDGIKWFLTYKTPLFDEQGHVTGTAGIAQDVTDRKNAEEEKQIFEQQMQHTQKLESLGVLSGGIAHDFNNILAIIMGYCSLTKMDYETAEVNIQEIEKAAERAAGLCRQMLAYAGKAQISMTQINMLMLVDEMVNMLKATLPQNAVIKPDLSTNIPFISADASQVRQIVMNLIINASEAIGKEQGEIRVSLTKSSVLSGHSEKDYHGKEIPPGSYVCLEVTDTGCGMDEETKWRIFEPFYTTKFTGRGLGMSAVLGIINSHNGALQLHSQLGQGTTFKVYLPAQVIETTGDGDQIHTPSAQWQGSGTILLVEDEDQIRNIAKILLQRLGVTVIEAVNGKEALELYQKNAADIRLVLTDMGMPVMDGYALFPALKQLNHKLPIIISSGFGDADVTSRIGRDNIAGIISKPYNPNQLREVLKSALEGAH